MPSAAPTKAAARLGAKIRLLRRQEGLSQVQLAEALGISPSYLNLIEGNKRPLTAPLLIRLAQQFKLDLKALAPDEDHRLSDDLMDGEMPYVMPLEGGTVKGRVVPPVDPRAPRVAERNEDVHALLAIFDTLRMRTHPDARARDVEVARRHLKRLV